MAATIPVPASHTTFGDTIPRSLAATVTPLFRNATVTPIVSVAKWDTLPHHPRQSRGLLEFSPWHAACVFGWPARPPPAQKN